MRDPNLMISLLHEMEKDKSGQILSIKEFGMCEDDQNRHHHLELLVDAGHAKWVSDQCARITNTGYDFINAIGQNKKYRDQFSDLFNRGMAFVDAAGKVIKMVNEAKDIIGSH